ncbi:MAG: hypothetical protein KDB14_34655, partial [Planctomycetales bacterium]|nr:hypothetical protein [Planctomycetales bacterium]
VFTQQMTRLQTELDEAVSQLEEHYADLQFAARQRLGRLFNAADYPDSLEGLFQVAWDFPSVEPPEYLRRLNPEVYRQECDRVASRFDEAVELAESAFIEELQSLVAHLTERLSGQVDGKPKVFRDSAIENLTQFFTRFRQLNVRSNEQLDELVGQCQQAVSGIEPQSLRNNNRLRQSLAGELSQVQGALDELLVDRPRRSILRRPR